MYYMKLSIILWKWKWDFSGCFKFYIFLQEMLFGSSEKFVELQIIH